VPHEKWTERPLLVVVPKKGQVQCAARSPSALLHSAAPLQPSHMWTGPCVQAPTREELLSFLEGKVARWWIPDDVVVVDDIPHTATGKISKLELRRRMQGYALPRSRL
jgi:fatty-acyl-CoA synthase